MRIAIVGAGMSGLSCADAVVGQGHEVALFDKARGPGGRMSTRRVAIDGRVFNFDHGAQYFTARDPGFVAQVAAWASRGIAVRWPEVGTDAWVGTPGMNAPLRAMAAVHDVTWNTRVEAITREHGRWCLKGAPAPGSFDAVVIAVPAEQARPLLAPVRSDLADRAARTRSAPCWTAMIAFDAPIGARITTVRDAGAIGWAARDGAKPGRTGAETWVIQASPDWSTQHLEETPEEVAAALFNLLEATLAAPLPKPVYLSAHRWRYARSGQTDGPGALWNAEVRIGACGDWLIAPRVEAAWLSGRRLAALIGEGSAARN